MRLTWILPFIAFGILLTTNLLQPISASAQQLPCRLPCWYNIKPGTTLFEDVPNMLSPYFGPESIYPSSNNGLNVCRDVECASYMLISRNEDDSLVNEIIIGFPHGFFPCSKFIEVYGEPDYFYDFYNYGFSTLFYDDGQAEIVLMPTEGNLSQNWVVNVWLRDAVLYATRLEAIRTEMTNRAFLTQFVPELHCAS